MYDGFCGRGNSNCQSNAPHVECEVVELYQPMVYLRHQISYKPGGQAWTYEKRKYFCHNHAESCGKRDSVFRVNQRNQ